MTAGFERARKIQPHRFRDRSKILPLRHALHAADIHPGQVVAGLGHERVAVCRLQVAEGGQGLLQDQ